MDNKKHNNNNKNRLLVIIQNKNERGNVHLTILVNVCIVWLTYEIGVGIQVVREHWYIGKKHPYVPPTILFYNDREKYLEWKEWKGDRFD